jgi:hypothetical protein
MGQLPNTLPAMIEKKLEKAMAFIPKSHVGQSSKDGLTFVQYATVLDYMTDNKLSRLTWIPRQASLGEGDCESKLETSHRNPVGNHSQPGKD